jgi:hypothetical protein
MNAANAGGAASKKTLRQPNPSIRTPPRLGPIATAKPLQLARIPNSGWPLSQGRGEPLGGQPATNNFKSDSGMRDPGGKPLNLKQIFLML